MSGSENDSEDDSDNAECECDVCRRGREFIGRIEGRMLDVWTVSLSLRHGDDWIMTPVYNVVARLGCDAEDVARAVKESSRDIFDLKPDDVKVIHVGIEDVQAIDIVADVRKNG